MYTSFISFTNMGKEKTEQLNSTTTQSSQPVCFVWLDHI